MQLDNTQLAKVTEWIGQGLKLAEIQNKLSSELGLTLTYMEARMLVDDLKLTPKDPEPPATPKVEAEKSPLEGGVPQDEPAPGGVAVTVDQLARPGALVSGKVVFSDGMKADWSLDEAGRLGLAAQQPGYRPSAGDVQQFQAALQNQLAKLGF